MAIGSHVCPQAKNKDSFSELEYKIVMCATQKQYDRALALGMIGFKNVPGRGSMGGRAPSLHTQPFGGALIGMGGASNPCRQSFCMK